MSALGFYAVDLVRGNYVVGSPSFDRASIQMGNGKQLVIETVENGDDKRYVQSVTWNGKPYPKSWFQHADVANGGSFVFHMGERPNDQFWAVKSARPPSFAPVLS